MCGEICSALKDVPKGDFDRKMLPSPGGSKNLPGPFLRGAFLTCALQDKHVFHLLLLQCFN
jgi:hypothetical protein